MRWSALALAAVVAVAPVVLIPSPASAAGVPAGIDPSVLVTDAAGPLFTGRDLAPGEVLERCLTLAWTQAGPSQIGLAADVSGDLGDHLAVEVAVGSGGGYASCAGFTGSAVFTGTLASLGAAHPDVTAPLALAAPGGAGATTVRVRMSVLDGAPQGRSAGAAFTFAITARDQDRPAGPPAPERDPVPSEPTPSPAPAVPTPGPPAPDAPADPPAPDAPAEQPVADEPAAEPPAGPPTDSVTVPMTPSTPAEPPATLLGSVAEVVKQAMALMVRASSPVARGVSWALWTLPLLFLFLLVQNRIDARDPKLADSPAQGAPSLAFDESYDAGDRGAVPLARRSGES